MVEPIHNHLDVPFNKSNPPPPMSPYIYSARVSGIGGLGRTDVRTKGLCLIRRSNKKMEFIYASSAKDDDGIGARKKIDLSSLRAEPPCRLVEGICSSGKESD
ncbi:uncharacterized protein G2W53_012345 [Senna tora]|uniref:Uncharacterized protein n=1 Tax=Senna tora TaxID=362788 RepID=A0A834TXJ0_9FABA|nr:uncharacterized protein G2W53_012345 [Senna tora]